MRIVQLKGRGDFAEWRTAARGLLAESVAPELVHWTEASSGGDLFQPSGRSTAPNADEALPTVPKAFLEAAQTAICHSDPGRFALLYRLLWRLGRQRQLLQMRSDADVVQLTKLIKNVQRDCHKMKAFVRFREVDACQAGRRRFVAWFEPDHFVVERTAGFFQRRFADMDWLIATPKGSAAWDGVTLKVSDEATAKPGGEDAMDSLWQTYFAHIFNPARLKIQAMQSEMPKKYWKNMPEAALIPDLIAGAERRVLEMAARLPSEPPAFHERLQARWHEVDEDAVPGAVSSDDPLTALRKEAAACTRCPLHCNATQTVFGEGRVGAPIMLVGEQPGDMEDLAGRPFVGPAGRVFDEAMAQAGLDRREAYVTNAVKHFKYEKRGKRRLHKRPEAQEIAQCRSWLTRELEVVGPTIIVALGATAYFSLTGESRAIAEVRGAPIPMSGNRMLMVTTHPSAILRMPDEALRQKSLIAFREDLTDVRRLWQTMSPQAASVTG